MKTLLTAITIAVLSTTAAASDIRWGGISASKDTLEVEGLGDFTGYGFDVTMMSSEDSFVTIKRSEIGGNAGVYNVGVKLNSLSIGLGKKTSISDILDIYLSVSYVSQKARIYTYPMMSPLRDAGLGATLGFKSMITSNIEFSGNVNRTKLGGATTTVNLEANYYVDDNFSVGLGYSEDDGIKSNSLIATIYF